MAYSQDYLEFVLEQLEDFGELIHKKMFGGVGFYKEEIMFGGIMGGVLHLKVDDETRSEYEAAAMGSFFQNEQSKSKPKYYEVPVDIIEDRTALVIWAEKAYQVALAAKKPKRRRRRNNNN